MKCEYSSLVPCGCAIYALEMITPGKHRASTGRHRAYSSRTGLLRKVQPVSAKERDIQIKRIYEAPARTDGCRLLVDRVWPRGIRKQDADLDDWLRELAPSTELRKWFGHDPQRWPEFRRRYRAELRQRAPELDALRQRAAHQRVTLLYGARDQQFNQAVVLKEIIQDS